MKKNSASMLDRRINALLNAVNSLEGLYELNGDLILAAPKLLEALEKASAFINNAIWLGVIDDSHVKDPETQDVLRSMETAIKAAKESNERTYSVH